jgi:SPW repeat
MEVVMANSLIEGKTRQDWINLVLAVCLFISPWVVGFAVEGTPTWNAWIVAVLLGVLAIGTLTVFAEWEEWANLALGLWLIISPWILGFAASMPATWTHLIMGVAVAAASAWAVWGHRHGPHAHA